MKRVCIITVLLSLRLLTIHGKQSKNIMEQLEEQSLSKEDYDKVVNIHLNWYLFSVKAIMAQMAKELLHKSDSASRERLKLCLKRIRHVKDLKDTAVCLIKAKEESKNYINSDILKEEKSEEAKAFVQMPVKSRSSLKKAGMTSIKKNTVAQKAFKNFLKSSLLKKIKWENRQSRQRRMKRSLRRLALSSEMNSDTKRLQTMKSKSLPALIESPPKSPVHRVSNLVVSLFGRTPDLRSKWLTTYKKLRELSEALEKNEKLPGARVYSARVYDLVMDIDKGTAQDLTQVDMPPFLKKVFDLVNSFKGGPNSRILSPRIAPVLPEKRRQKGFLSPTLFPFYKDDKEEQILPIPNILEKAGVSESDREKVIEMIMEVSGAQKTVDRALSMLQSLDSFVLGKKFLSVTEKIGKHFEQLDDSMSSFQRKELNRRGFTFMELAQMKKLYNQQELNEPEINAMVKEYEMLAKEQREEALWETIAKIAGKTRRRKRQISILRPTILSPVLFSPVTGLTVLGVAVLAPSLFAPFVLAPSVLTPVILSPGLGIPFILSPYVLSPFILSPGLLNIIVLSPNALSPSILGPSALGLLVLSPFALSPSVLSPSVLGGAVLSPNVLSPSILSKSFLVASVLSPSFLS